MSSNAERISFAFYSELVKCNYYKYMCKLKENLVLQNTLNRIWISSRQSCRAPCLLFTGILARPIDCATSNSCVDWCPLAQFRASALAGYLSPPFNLSLSRSLLAHTASCAPECVRAVGCVNARASDWSRVAVLRVFHSMAAAGVFLLTGGQVTDDDGVCL